MVTLPVKPLVPEASVKTWFPDELKSTVKPEVSALFIVIAAVVPVSLIASMSEDTLRVLPPAIVKSAKEIVS